MSPINQKQNNSYISKLITQRALNYIVPVVNKNGHFKQVGFLVCGHRADFGLKLSLLGHSYTEDVGVASPTSGRKIQNPIFESAMDLLHNKCIWM